MSYIAFLAAGTTASSVMMSASFESMYSALSRMHVQRTWEAIMHAPLTLGDVVLGEILWAASKVVLSGVAIMLVAGALGYAQFPGALAALPVIVLAGIAFASLAMIVTALAPSYDFFMFYQTLVMTPMLLLSGVFFPLEQLPAGAQAATQVLPLAHAVALIRPLMLGRPVEHGGLHRPCWRCTPWPRCWWRWCCCGAGCCAEAGTPSPGTGRGVKTIRLTGLLAEPRAAGRPYRSTTDSSPTDRRISPSVMPAAAFELPAPRGHAWWCTDA